MGRDFLHLQRGNYLLHIYTRTDNVSVNANLIVYSSIPVNLTYRKENYELSGYKKKMAETIFLNSQNNMEKLMNTDRVFSKFIWDGFRGILVFISDEPAKVKITVLIKEEYRRKIKFEHSDQYEEIVFLKPGSKKIVSFVKFISNDVGNFYSIAIHKQENYQYPNPMMKKTSSNQSNHSPIQNYPSSSNTPRTGELQSSPFKKQEYDNYE